MDYIVFKNIKSPDELLEKIKEYTQIIGLEIYQDIEDDLNVCNMKYVDGKRFGVYDKEKDYFINFRSANETHIFGKMGEGEQELRKSRYYTGVGMIVSEDYTPHKKWYNQINVPQRKDETVCGAFMPLLNPSKPPEIKIEEINTELKKISLVEFHEEIERPRPTYIKAVVKYYDKPNLDDYKVNVLGKEFTVLNNYNRVHGEIRDHIYVFDELLHKYGDDFVLLGADISVDSFTGASYPIYKNLKVFPLPNRISIDGKTELTIEQLKKSKIRWGSTQYPRVQNDIFYLEGAAVVRLLDEDVESYKNLRVEGFPYIMPSVKNNTYLGLKLYNPHKSGGIPQVSYVDLVVMTKEAFQKILNNQTSDKDEETLVLEYRERLNRYKVDKQAQEEFIKEYEKKIKAERKENLIPVEDIKRYEGWLINTVSPYIKSMKEYYMNLNSYTLYCNYYEDTELTGTSLTFSLVKNPNPPVSRKILGLELPEPPEIPKVPKEESNMYLLAKNPKNAINDKQKERYQEQHDLVLATVNEYNRQVDEYNIALPEFNKRIKEYQKELKIFLEKIRNMKVEYEEEIILDPPYQVTHLVVGELIKYGNYDGGVFFSGSANDTMLDSCYRIYLDEEENSDKYILPVLGTADKSSTFVRVNNDKFRKQGIKWLSSGTSVDTGGYVISPIRISTSTVAPNYRYMQSKDSLDSNCTSITSGLSLRLPIFFCADIGGKYAPMGEVAGIHYCSMLNMQTAGVYKFEYPKDKSIDQAFSMGRRRGEYGFDGISIKQ